MTNKTTTKNDLGQLFVKLETFLDLYLGKKAPSIPDKYKEMVVKFGPYILLLPILFEIQFVLAFISGLFFVGSRLGYGFPIFSFFNLLILVMTVLQIVSFFWLIRRQKRGWTLIYYVSLISLLSSPISAVVSLYLLFQIKSYYK